jgi:hypothetical protein
VCLPQEVSGWEAFFSDPLAQHRALAGVVRAAEVAKRFGDGECTCHRHAQFVRRRPSLFGVAAAVPEVRDVDPEVSEASRQVTPEVAVWLGAEKGDDLVDVGALFGGLRHPLAGVLHTTAHEVPPLARPLARPR